MLVHHPLTYGLIPCNLCRQISRAYNYVLFNMPTSCFAEVFVTATFGFLPLSCLPGSIVSTDTFARIGSFISVAREDSEWILRSRLIGVEIS